MTKKNDKKRVVTKFTLSEISAVGKPAQEPALIALSKSAAEELAAKQVEDTSMTEAEKKQLEDLQKAQAEGLELIKTLTANNERLTKEQAMSSDVRTYYDALPETDQPLFIAKSVTVQDAEVQNAKLANAVIYKDVNGNEYRKSDDPRLIQMAKQADEQRTQMAALTKSNADLQLKKQLDEFKHLPGDEKARTALLKSVNAIADETERTAALTALKAHDGNLAKYFKVTGNTGNGEGEPAPTSFYKSGSDELDVLVKAHIDANPGTSTEVAFDTVLQTSAGEAAYERLEYAS